MRKVVVTNNPKAPYRRAMIFAPDDGGWVYLFLFRSLEDGPCEADWLYEDVAGAEHHAAQDLCCEMLNWQPIPDPLPECQDDWIAPVRAVRDAAGRIRFEHLTEQ